MEKGGKSLYSNIFKIMVTVTLVFFNSLMGQEVEDTKFAFGRGFYDSFIHDTITTATDGAEIVYTLDGSDPKTSSKTFVGGDTVIVRIDPDVSGTISGNLYRPNTPAITLRAYARKSGYESTDVDVQTYIFVNNVIYQTSTDPGSGWPTENNGGSQWSSQYFNYGMDASLVSNPTSVQNYKDALKAIPSISLVSELGDLFGGSGIYSNPWERDDGHGSWERYTSMELINPDGTGGFQVHAGLRIRGGWSRHGDNPKHAFRLFFRSEYGDSKLKYPLFEDEGVDKFDKIDLRTSQNYSWSFHGGYGDPEGPENTFIREVLNRDIQGVMGQPYTKSRYYHLYLNGMYWGLYQTEERPESDFAASYFGGEDDDYDVMKTSSRSNYQIDVSDGNDLLFNDLYNFYNDVSRLQDTTEYFNIQGRFSNGSSNPAFDRILDAENLIDYMTTVYYSGDKDAPITAFHSNKKLNNLYCLINHKNPDGFKFIRHDGEHTFGLGHDDRTHSSVTDSVPKNVSYFNPQSLHVKLAKYNAEYRILFTDRVYKHFNNDGSRIDLISENLITSRKNVVDGAIRAEAQRWGDAQRPGDPYTRGTWVSAVEKLNNFIGGRGNDVLNQFKNRGWYPETWAPDIYVNEQKIEGSIVTTEIIDSVVIDNIYWPNGATPHGSMRYTLDGSDPREIGASDTTGLPSIHGGDRTVFYNGSIPEVLKVRTYNGSRNEWSPLREIYFIKSIAQNDLTINEIHYHPFDSINPSDTSDVTDETDFQFIEIKNTGSTSQNLTGVSFTSGVMFTFPENTILEPDSFFVIASSPADFERRYGVKADGWFKGELSKAGESVVLVDALGGVIDSVTYLDEAPWYEETDGEGVSLIRIGSGGNSSDPVNWTASKAFHGSPGEENSFDKDPIALTALKFSEIHYNPLDSAEIDDDNFEFIELQNTGSTPLSLSGVRFTSGVEYVFPDSIIAPDSVIVIAANATLFEALYGFAPFGEFSKGLSNSGETVVLRDASGNLIDRVTYDDMPPWPIQADGLGNSLAILGLTDTTNTAAALNWTYSHDTHGSPGEVNAVPQVTITFRAGAHGILQDTNGVTTTTQFEQIVLRGNDAMGIEAIAEYGYSFKEWHDGDSANPRVILNPTADVNLLAIYETVDVTLTYSTDGNGVITGDTAQVIAFSGVGTEVSVAAKPGYEFIGWSDGKAGLARTDTVATLDSLMIAQFELNVHPVSVTAGANGSVTAMVDSLVIDGSTLDIVATPDAQFHFIQWVVTGSLTVTDLFAPTTQITNVIGSGSVIALFGIDVHTYMYKAGANGSIVGDTVQIIGTGLPTTNVEAQPDSGYHFVSWSDGSVITLRSDAFVMSDSTITAQFDINIYDVTLIAGKDTVSKALPFGTNMSIGTGVPPFATFSHWAVSEGLSVLEPDSNITKLSGVAASGTVEAVFAYETYTANYFAGVGGVLVGEVSQLIEYGSSITAIQAVPDSGFTFSQWSDGSMDNPRIDMNITEAITLTAGFVIDTARGYVLDTITGIPVKPVIDTLAQIDSIAAPIFDNTARWSPVMDIIKTDASIDVLIYGLEQEVLSVVVFDFQGRTVAQLENHILIDDAVQYSWDLMNDGMAYLQSAYVVVARIQHLDGTQQFVNRVVQNR